MTKQSKSTMFIQFFPCGYNFLQWMRAFLIDSSTNVLKLMFLKFPL